MLIFRICWFCLLNFMVLLFNKCYLVYVSFFDDVNVTIPQRDISLNDTIFFIEYSNVSPYTHSAPILNHASSRYLQIQK